MFALASAALVQLSAVIGIGVAILGGLYTMLRFPAERRAGRIAEEDFYQRMYRDMNAALIKEIERLKAEVAERDATIAGLRANG